MEGWIKLHRDILDWEWYTDIRVKTVFIHLLLTANHKERNWRGLVIKRGQLYTSVKHLSTQVGISIREVRSALGKLERTNEIMVKPTNKGTMVTICKYDVYQGEIDFNAHIDDKQKTNERQTKDKHPANKRQTKDNKQECQDSDNLRRPITGNKLNEFIPPSLEEVTEYCKGRNNSIKPEQWLNFYQSNGWMIGKNKMKDWKASIRTWENNNKPKSNLSHLVQAIKIDSDF